MFKDTDGMLQHMYFFIFCGARTGELSLIRGNSDEVLLYCAFWILRWMIRALFNELACNESCCGEKLYMYLCVRMYACVRVCVHVRMFVGPWGGGGGLIGATRSSC